MVRRRWAAVLAALALAVGACGDEEAPPPTASDDTERVDALGPGSWTGARTTDDGLLMTLVGGKPYAAGNPCTVEYSARTEESDDEVRVGITATSPAPPPEDADLPLACTAEGHFRTVAVDLARPLGTRRLVEAQFDRAQPVFDGSTLLEPGELPEGWSQLSEGPGFPRLGALSSWSRTWGPPEPPPTDGHCTPAPAAVTLTQGPPAIAEGPAPNGERTVSTHDVGGVEATYAEAEAANSRRLTWVAGGLGFVLTSVNRCVGDPPTPVETLVDLARSLR